MRMRGALLTALAATAAVAFVAPAQGAVTIGTNLGFPADESNPGCATACTTVNTALSTDAAPDGLASPVNGTVTTWRFKSVTAGGSVSLRVLRPAGGANFMGVGTSTAVTSPGGAGVHGPFTAGLPIQTGDLIGLNASPPATIIADVPATQLYWNAPTLADGQTLPGTTGNREVVVQAVVEPANTLNFGAVTRNKKKGRATLTVNVPNPGRLDYSGTAIKIAETAAEKTVTAPGPVKFLIKATGKKRKKLNSKGKVSVKPTFTFTPNNGTAATQTTSVLLKRTLTRKS